MAESVSTSSTQSDYAARFGGIGRLYGTEGWARLRAAHVCVIGIGGVGSWTVEALARSGIGALTLVDMDEICVTNVNRQLHALDGQVGVSKVEAMAARMRLINPECRVTARTEFFTAKNAGAILDGGYTEVVDAIDSVHNKCLLLAECRDRGLPVVTCGGAGGRRDPTLVRVADLSQTTHDPLLVQVRKLLRTEHGFPKDPKQAFGVPCVFSPEPVVYPQTDGTVCDTREPGSELGLKCESGFGTATFVTGTFGFVLAAQVVERIAGKRG